MIGENLQEEWDNDSASTEVWNAINQLQKGDRSGLEELKKVAERRSLLANMYLGHFYTTGEFGVDVDKAMGTRHLEFASKAGSIEASFRLMKWFRKEGQDNEALVLLRSMSEQQYPPALFLLGIHHYEAKILPKDQVMAEKLFSQAASAGHVLAAQWMAQIMMGAEHGIISNIRGFFKKFILAFSYTRLRERYPNSDRIRN